MPAPVIWGFCGDFFSFVGALILALDALWRQREFVRQKKLVQMIKVLKEVRLTLRGVELVDDESANLVLIRQSVLRAVWGAGILAVGFICLLISRALEVAK
jgi:hypothetical protein